MLRIAQQLRVSCFGIFTFVLLMTMCCTALAAPNILMVTTNNGSLTYLEAGRKSQFEAAGFVVNTIWDGASQATFTSAFANNIMVYLPDEATEGELGYKLREAPIGVVSEHPGLADELGFCSSAATTTSGNTINITYNTHYITNVFATGSLTLGTGTYTISRMGGTTASGGQVLATAGGVNSVVAIDSGATLANTYNSSNVAFGRRVHFPLPVSVNDGSTFNFNTFTLALRMVNWAAGLDRTLVGHWKLDEASGTTAADSSVYTASGTVTGTASWTSAVRKNGFNFDGNTKIQVSGLFSNPKNISVAAWAKLTTADTNGAEIISLGDHFVLRLDESGMVKGIMYDGSTWQTVSASGTYAGAGWHHFAAVFDDDNDTFKLYIDGTLAATASITASINYTGLGANTVIGRNGNGGTANDFVGMIDDVRVYNYALSAAEVETLHGFVGRWKLNETAGATASDATISPDNGTVAGTARWSTDCGGTGVFDFDGSTNYLSVASSAPLLPKESITIAAWVRGDSWGSGDDADTIVRKGDTSPYNYALCIADGKVALLLDEADTAGSRSTTVLSTGTWYHVAATWDGTTVKIYINGVLDRSVARSGTIGVDTRPLYIGGRTGSTDMFDGMMRDVRVYNRALSSTEIQALAGLVGYWAFSEGTGTTAADTSGQGNNATLSGGAGWTSDCSGSSNALLTNGTGGIAQTATAVAPPSIGTVAFWMRGAGPLAARGRLCGVNGDWEIRQEPNGALSFDLGGSPIVGNEPFSTLDRVDTSGKWYHIAATFDDVDNTFAVYIDGVLRTSGTSPVDLVPQSSGILSFGARTGSTEYWNGALRDFRIYNRKLCPREIAPLAGLVGRWRLVETAGTTAADSSPMTNNGTYMNGVSLAGSVKTSATNEYAAKFDGVDDYVSISNESDYDITGPITVAAWIRADSFTGTHREIVSKGGYAWRLRYRPDLNKMSFKCTGLTTEEVVSTNCLSLSRWYHVAGVYTGSVLQLYINGALNNSVSSSGAISKNNFLVNIGRNAEQTGREFNGAIFDARVYNRALCPTEISQLYGSPFGGVKIIKWNEIQ